jgi:hypothetical protein
MLFINDGYCQLVSCFAIFCQDGILAESGGYASVTNSATNFGTYALRSVGYRDKPYSFHVGKISNITFNEIGTPTLEITGLGGKPLEHYIIKIGDVINQNSNIEYFIDTVVGTTASPPFTATVQANSAMQLIGNYNRFKDAANLLEANAAYIAEEAFFVELNQGVHTFHPDYSKCIRDTQLIIEAWASDLRRSGNSVTWDAAQEYITGGAVQHINGFEAATKAVFAEAAILAKKAINNLLRKKGTTLTTDETNAGYYVALYTEKNPFVDLTVIHDVSSPGGLYSSADCANVQSAIDSLNALVADIIDQINAASRDTGAFTLNALNKDIIVGSDVFLHRPSIVNSSSHTWEYAGSGNNYNALPQNGGQTGSQDTADFEQVSQDYGRVYSSGTDELGDFKVGYFAKVENRTGNITFGGTVTISEVEFLRIKGGDIVVTGFSADNTLGDAFASDSLLPSQKAVKEYISNNLGNYLNKPYSTNPTPRALVELGDNGRINIDQLPALRPFNVYTVADEADRLALEGPLAGDIAIQQDTTISYILNNDLSSQALEFVPDDRYQFTVGSIVTGVPTLAQGQVILYKVGFVKFVTVINGGSGYTSAPAVTIGASWTSSTSYTTGNQIAHLGNLYTVTSGGTSGATAPVHTSGEQTINGVTYKYAGERATATANIANGRVTSYTITNSGSGYTVTPVIFIDNNGSGGTGATASSFITGRLYITIANNIKFASGDVIEDETTPTPFEVTILSTPNTSAQFSTNWVQLTSSTIDASFITSGVISTARLANVTTDYPANSISFLRGDSRFAPAVQSLRALNTSTPIVLSSNFTRSSYIREIRIANGGSGYTPGSYSEQNLFGGAGDGLKANIIVANGVVSRVTVTNGGAGYTTAPLVSFTDSLGNNIATLRAVAVVTGGVVTEVFMLDGGSNLSGPVNVIFTPVGGAGASASATTTISNGSISRVTITDGGIGYTADFTITPLPSSLLGGTGASLRATLANVVKNFADVDIDIRRQDGLTVSTDPFGNIGVARFKKDQFNFFENGGIELKTGSGSGLDADLLDGQQGNYYTNASNLSSGTLDSNRLSGTYTIDVTGQSGNTLRLSVQDTRTQNLAPSTFATGLQASLQQNNSTGLTDGGIYHSVTTLRRGGAGTDFALGAVSQLGLSDNINVFLRGSGPNYISQLTLTTAGSGYQDGTYLDVPLRGGEGSGLTATITVSGGVFTNVTMTNRGHGYNKTGSAPPTFTALLPYEYFGNNRSAVITVTIATLGSNTFSSWYKVWTDANDGRGSGLDADLLDGRDSLWLRDAKNINYGMLSDRRLQTTFTRKNIIEQFVISKFSSAFSTTGGAIYDLYLEGVQTLNGELEALDTQTGTAGIQLNLYTSNNVNTGTVRLIAQERNLDGADFYWTANTAYVNNRLITYGHNVYLSTASISNSGTNPPVHPSGTVNNLQWVRKVTNAWTRVTAELVSGNIDDTVTQIGTASVPATYYQIAEWSIANNRAYQNEGIRLKIDSNNNPNIELGYTNPLSPNNGINISSTPYIDFHSAANTADYDVRVVASGGGTGTTIGQGTLNVQANNLQVNGNNVWHAGNVAFATANTANTAVLRDASGNFSAGTITANLTGAASENLALTGGTLTGTLTFTTSSDNVINITSAQRFFTWAGGLQFRGSGSTFNARFSTTDATTITQILGAYSQNFAAERFGIYANGSAVINTTSQRLVVNGSAWDNSSGGGVKIENSGTNGAAISLVPTASTATNGALGWAWYAGASGSAIGDGNFGLWAHGTNLAPLAVDRGGNFLIGAVSASNRPSSSYKLRVDGTFAATSKSFVIDHPTKENYQLVYGSLEGPEHGVYVRGKVTDGVIELPDYWTALVDENTITVQLTPIGNHMSWVEIIGDNKIIVGGGAAFYFVQAMRKDIDKLEVEVEMLVVKEEEI